MDHWSPYYMLAELSRMRQLQHAICITVMASACATLMSHIMQSTAPLLEAANAGSTHIAIAHVLRAPQLRVRSPKVDEAPREARKAGGVAGDLLPVHPGQSSTETIRDVKALLAPQQVHAPCKRQRQVADPWQEHTCRCALLASRPSPILDPSLPQSNSITATTHQLSSESWQ